MAFLQGETDVPVQKQKPKVKGRVVVVGAGPAGLAAALHLQVSTHMTLIVNRCNSIPLLG